MLKKIGIMAIAASLFSVTSLANDSQSDEEIDFGIAVPSPRTTCPNLANNERRFICREVGRCQISIGERVIASASDFTIEFSEGGDVTMLNIEITETGMYETPINIIPFGGDDIVFSGFYETRCGTYGTY